MCIPEPRLTRRESLSLAAAALLAPRLKGSRPRTVNVGGGLEIHPRSEWGADLLPKGPLPAENDVRFLLVHHTAATTNYSEDAVIRQMRGIYSFHTGSQKNWNDVCYNFFVDRFGGVWEGRAGSLNGPVMADATGGSQGFAQLVCLLGNFEENLPTAEMISSLEKVLAWLAVRYRIDPAPGSTTSFVSRGSNKWSAGTNVVARTISGHRDMSKTACPGKNVYPLLDSVIPGNVAALVTTWSGTPVASPPPENPVETTAATTTSASTTLAEETTTTAPPTTEISTTSPTSTAQTSTTQPTPSSQPDSTTTSPPSTDSDSTVVEAARAVAITAGIVGVAAAGAAVVHRRDR